MYANDRSAPGLSGIENEGYRALVERGLDAGCLWKLLKVMGAAPSAPADLRYVPRVDLASIDREVATIQAEMDARGFILAAAPPGAERMRSLLENDMKGYIYFHMSCERYGWKDVFPELTYFEDVSVQPGQGIATKTHRHIPAHD